jgi:hypothetical protein
MYYIILYYNFKKKKINLEVHQSLGPVRAKKLCKIDLFEAISIGPITYEKLMDTLEELKMDIGETMLVTDTKHNYPEYLKET